MTTYTAEGQERNEIALRLKKIIAKKCARLHQ